MISVIIPIYNAEKSIEKSLISIKDQTWKGEFEILIVNDGCFDKSVEIIEAYQEKNPDQKITVIHQENGGVSKARNTALKIAKGNFIAFLDADDEWLPEKTMKQMKIFELPDFVPDFLATRRLNHHLRYPYKIGENNLAEITFRKLMFRNEAQPSTIIFKRKIIENTGFFDDFQKYAEDLNYWLKISHKNKMYILNEELIILDNGKRSFGVSGLSANLQEMEKGFIKNLKEMLNMKRIGINEFLIYFTFYKLKYIFRVIRNNYLKLLGK